MKNKNDVPWGIIIILALAGLIVILDFVLSYFKII